jgi:hypothetical protein
LDPSAAEPSLPGAEESWPPADQAAFEPASAAASVLASISVPDVLPSPELPQP